ncbi:STYKc [Aspergillus sclerotialis]|uniref:STYKc n=1 Tax=Aspergillus sclerotialis TaxID=2070753 RepID=A0A3A2Z7G1_9EURO|nr:STYKc [Aspergillus sclerotialis]
MLKPLWHIWSWLWRTALSLSQYVIWPLSRLVSTISLTGSREARGDDEERSHPGNDLSYGNSSHNIITRRVIERPSNQKLLIIGIFAEVYLLDGKVIRKTPRSENEEDMQPIIREATIYNIIGIHPRIVECMSRGGGRAEYVDVKYYPHGDLASYCQKNKITPELRSRWFQQIIEAIIVIHDHGVVHSDLALRQFFVDDNLDLRLGDFNSSQYADHPALGYEKATHCLPRDYELPNTESSDIFALGSTLYELVAGRAPYSELSSIGPESNDPDSIKAKIQRQHQADLEIESRYKNQKFPDVSNIFRGDIILGCWRGDFPTAKDALHLYVHG